jgi:hypothetical protein
MSSLSIGSGGPVKQAAAAWEPCRNSGGSTALPRGNSLHDFSQVPLQDFLFSHGI